MLHTTCNPSTPRVFAFPHLLAHCVLSEVLGVCVFGRESSSRSIFVFGTEQQGERGEVDNELVSRFVNADSSMTNGDSALLNSSHSLARGCSTKKCERWSTRSGGAITAMASS